MWNFWVFTFLDIHIKEKWDQILEDKTGLREK